MSSRLLRQLPQTQPAAAAPVQLSLAVPHEPATALPQLWLGVHLPQSDPVLLQRLGVLAQRFTPRVSLEPPDGLVLEVQGSLALFGGVAKLYRAFRAGCHAAGAAPVITVPCASTMAPGLK